MVFAVMAHTVFSKTFNILSTWYIHGWYADSKIYVAQLSPWWHNAHLRKWSTTNMKRSWLTTPSKHLHVSQLQVIYEESMYSELFLPVLANMTNFIETEIPIYFIYQQLICRAILSILINAMVANSMCSINVLYINDVLVYAVHSAVTIL